MTLRKPTFCSKLSQTKTWNAMNVITAGPLTYFDINLLGAQLPYTCSFLWVQSVTQVGEQNRIKL